MKLSFSTRGWNDCSWEEWIDTATDMHCAVNAGMLPIGALWGFRTAEELQSSGARQLVQHPMDVLSCLEL